MDRDVLLEALGTICNATVTSIQKETSTKQEIKFGLGLGSAVAGVVARVVGGAGAASSLPTLSSKTLISTVLTGDQTCHVSRSNLIRMRSAIDGAPQLYPKDGSGMGTTMALSVSDETKSGKLIIDEDEFFDHRYDYDFTNVEDKKTYYRGGEKYERPCGWHRTAIKVFDKYCDNAWLGTTYRSTESNPGEWPVSYHGTTDKGAGGIIEGHYKPGPRQRYGRGVYSTPDLSVAADYAKRFQSKKTKKWYKVILQNRINPKYREKHNKDQYWVIPIPTQTSDEDEQKLVDAAIRPYGLLLKED